ncbi:putative mitochondrial carrier protein [Hyaloraphidium curvatum]|nr:putative mitochondrial carrier protein [Hyaloraphidium curvatum]
MPLRTRDAADSEHGDGGGPPAALPSPSPPSAALPPPPPSNPALNAPLPSSVNAGDASGGNWSEPSASTLPLAVVTQSQQTLEASASARTVNDKRSFDYVWRSLVAGGVAGCVAKTVIAPLDRVKILFQTNSPKYRHHSGSFRGVFTAAREIHGEHGVRGLFQGHLATLLRIFPYAAVKFMAFEQYKLLLMPTPEQETSFRHLMAGSMAGVTSVFCTYPLELIRVRMAVTTTSTGGLLGTVNRIFHEPNPLFDRISSALHVGGSGIGNQPLNPGTAPGSSVAATSYPRALLQSFFNDARGVANFYRGFLPTIYGMIPYAGVSFWTYDVVTQLLKTSFGKWTIMPAGSGPPRAVGKKGRSSKEHLKVWAQLFAGAVAGAVSQTCSYPLEVIRRHMQIAGSPEVHGQHRHAVPHYRNTWQTARHIYEVRGWRGFFVGLSIGYLKVTPMVAVSFAVYEQMKRLLAID